MCRGEKMTNKSDEETMAEKSKVLLPPTPSSSSEIYLQLELEKERINRSMTNIHSSTKKRTLSKQLSMKETCREAKWEHRRRQINHRRRSMNLILHIDNETDNMDARVSNLTDEDMDELRGSIDLGFGFNEEDGGHHLRDTLPALNLYFAVNRQLSDPAIRYTPSPGSTPMGKSDSEDCLCGAAPSPGSPQADQLNMDWKIVNAGDNPQDVKARLRHWAQAVACSVKQSC